MQATVATYANFAPLLLLEAIFYSQQPENAVFTVSICVLHDPVLFSILADWVSFRNSPSV